MKENNLIRLSGIMLNNILEHLPPKDYYSLRSTFTEMSRKIPAIPNNFYIRNYLKAEQSSEKASRFINFIIAYGSQINYTFTDPALRYLATNNITQLSDQSTIKQIEKVCEQEEMTLLKNSLKFLVCALLLISLPNKEKGIAFVKASQQEPSIKRLPKITLKYAHLSEANLQGANLEGANLQGANLSLANLGGANLQGANLGEANLILANLRGANLGGANLILADLGGANLVGVDLRYVNLKSCIGVEKIRFLNITHYTSEELKTQLDEFMNHIKGNQHEPLLREFAIMKYLQSFLQGDRDCNIKKDFLLCILKHPILEFSGSSSITVFFKNNLFNEKTDVYKKVKDRLDMLDWQHEKST